MSKYTLDQIRAAFKAKGYAFFETGSYNLNIFGIRLNGSDADRFDDLLCVAYKDEAGTWVLKEYAATTDPGLFFRLNPMAADKCTHTMLPGQYKGAYEIGFHQWKPTQPALVQVKPIRFAKDCNKDARLDIAGMPTINELIGANIHGTYRAEKQERVWNWSAACQVVQDATQFNEFIQLCNKASRTYGKRFTYTLFNSTDIS